MQKTLQALGEIYGTDKATYHGFCDFYQKLLPDKVRTLLEFGVLNGASLRMWADFYPEAKIIGVDIESKSHIASDRIEVIIANQDNAIELCNLRLYLHEKYKEIDVVIDDGGHTMDQQENTIREFLPICKYYIIEDLHTSLYSQYGDGRMLKMVAGGLQDFKHMISDIKVFSKNHANGEKSITSVIKTIN